MRMLKWMSGVTRKDKNEVITGTVKVTNVSKKMQEVWLRWFSHAMRSEEGSCERQIMDMKWVAGGKEEDPGQDGKTVLWQTAERRTWPLEWRRTEVAGGDSSKTATLHRDGIIMLKKMISTFHSSQ